MKRLEAILIGVEPECIIGTIGKQIEDICFDSRKATHNSLFVACVGIANDGHKYIDQIINQGACCIVCQILPQKINENITYIKVKSSDEALGIIASNYFDNPSDKLNLVGITGTNGKTTTVTLLHSLFMSCGYKTGLISTIVNKINNSEIPTTHTTPDAITLNKLLAEMVSHGCEYVFMEVSSHAIVQNRIVGLRFFGGIFSNITHDHLDYHKTFDNYIKAKKLFFDNLPKTAFALANIDDKHALIMLQNTKAKKHTYSLTTLADFHATILENTFNGLTLTIDEVEIFTQLIGRFNASNVLAIYSTAMLCGLEKYETLRQISLLHNAEGRFDCLEISNGAKAIVDYAHTPDALSNVLLTINEIRQGRGKVIVVVGCGGDRDRQKRPCMAAIAQKESDILILTSDNPRSEDPQEIIEEMETGLITKQNVLIIPDRLNAIKTACTLSTKDDIVLVAGKGHEKYQEIKGKKYPFDDKEVLLKFNN
jgi:UDP-N-acetylmuramoyl-L-alanyl-D-glutamate--2,6-diaminopimelate ligase